MGKIILISSGKGGVGKTTLVSNLGILLAMSNKKVLLVDMGMGLRNLDLFLGVENRVVYNVRDVLSGLCRVKKALIKDDRLDNLYVIPAPQGLSDDDLSSYDIKSFYDELRESFDYILVDAPSGIGEDFQLSIKGIDKAIVVVEPDIASIRDAEIVDKILYKSGVLDRMLLINKARMELMSMGFLPNIADISRKFRIPLLGIIQFDENILVSSNQGIPIVMKKNTYISKNFEGILDRFVGEK